MRLLLVLGFLLAVGAARPAGAERPIIETTEMSAVQAAALELGEKYGPEHVLVVFDIDNTLLTMRHDLGSDAWFKWQDGLLESDKANPRLVAPDFTGLLAAQYALYALGDMRATEAGVPAMLNGLEGLGFKVMALTARGPETRDATLRELGDAGIDFNTRPECEDPLCADGVFISAARVQLAARDVFDADERGRFRIDGVRRPASYGRGVMMVSGQHKGAMLRLFLDSIYHETVAAVVFADDGRGNVEDVAAALADQEIESRLFWYERFEADVNAFAKDAVRQEKVTTEWRAIREPICAALGTFCAP